MIRISFQDVTVQFPIFNARGMSLRNHLIRIGTGGLIEKDAVRHQIVTALKNVSFELHDGDRVGLVGHNGAGKSTLLRTFAGIYFPTQGRIFHQGKISTLLELGAGMDAELSGEENVIRMGLIQGMTLEAIRDLLPAIVEFSDLGDFIHLPVRTYSAGMSTRLMFAVATCWQPEILVIDEIFGAGDEVFQNRARERMEKLLEQAGLFVFASHSGELIRRYCNRFFRLEHGTLTEVYVDAVHV